ncbi:alpha/beta fold hydrolase [Streptomyces sp. DSM 44917]|uniref:Alpha/beta fold hydrolase n=1 Tax=Streptomyces boetiae TaxID=3075541 RepID=A0ABU2L363_9ACTN|nr:alpha/beta fold hydrolase [Streptomyces sp. DSM 44917]MDT0305846.1 alpha/beta fold hydrolase [Streptomyces sp. DSM 44917]
MTSVARPSPLRFLPARLRRIRPPRGRAGRALAAAAALLVLAAVLLPLAARGEEAPTRREEHVLRLPESPGSRETVSIDTTFVTAGDPGRPRPAVLLAHGMGGSKADLADDADRLARAGYAVLTWSARGFGASGGRIGLNDPDREVADVSRLIDWLARRPEVQLDAEGDPRVGISGSSYGGAVALLAAGHDPRVDALAPRITYWDLSEALFPGGVFKRLWAGLLFTTGSTDLSGGSADASGCGRFTPELCALYERVATSGEPDEEARRLLAERSPAAVADRIAVPTLILQGQHDSLFPLGHADAMARAIEANGAPVAVDWLWAGHDGGLPEDGRAADRVTAWFDRHLAGREDAGTGPAFRVTRISGFDSANGATLLRGASGDAYPGLDGGARETVPLGGQSQTFVNPPGGAPPALSAVPGLGALSEAAALGFGLSLDIPGQHAAFDSAPLAEPLRVTGSPRVRVTLASDSPSAVVFAKLYDIAPDGERRILPAGLVTPLRVEGTNVPGGRTVEIRLPAVDHPFEAGHRMRLVLSSTDLGYASPAEPATLTAALTGPGLTVPTAPGVHTGAAPLPAWTWAMPPIAAALAALLLATGRRRPGPRRLPPPDPALAETPLRLTGLTKRYAGAADRYAVRDLDFTVERGQILGLLGPNGAGKTTTLRMLMGLITPDAGEIRVFGHAVRPGAPVLSRVGAFVEGPGFLPHLTGRANLDLYWQATGRPAADAHRREALEIAGLGEAVDRPVRTYSQGMRQRLAIAQAMLGLPDLLILDEPTNGLDPPQIRAMREVMIRYAAGGRTVVVSSHLLAEVEQTCTHLVVMAAGRLVESGPVAEIAGHGTTLLATTPAPLTPDLLERVAALPGVAGAEPADSGLLVRLAPGADPAALVVGLVRLGVPVHGLVPHRRLEDAFLTLIGGSAP